MAEKKEWKDTLEAIEMPTWERLYHCQQCGILMYDFQSGDQIIEGSGCDDYKCLKCGGIENGK